jgi:hypothetical protein
VFYIGKKPFFVSHVDGGSEQALDDGRRGSARRQRQEHIIKHTHGEANISLEVALECYGEKGYAGLLKPAPRLDDQAQLI